MKLKKLLFVLVIVCPAFFLTQSCEKIKDEINKAAAFDVEKDLPNQHFTLDSSNFKSSSSVQDDWTVMYEFDVYVDVDSIFDAHDLSSASIKDGTVSMMRVSMDNPPAGVSFDFVNAMKATVADDVSFSNEVEVASTGSISSGATSVTFNLNNANITSYIDKKNFYIRLYGDKNSPAPLDDILMVLESSVKFTVEPL